MTVAELIKILQTVPPDARIAVSDDEIIIKAVTLCSMRDGSHVVFILQNYTDAYSSEKVIWEADQDRGD